MDSRKRDHLMEQLSAYVDDELTPAQRREVEAFLAEDAEARTLLGELRATAQSLRDLPRAKASDRLLEGIRTRMEREALLGRLPAAAPVPPERSLGLRWIAAAAVIGLTVGTLYLIGPMSRREAPVITVASADRKAGDEKYEQVAGADRAHPDSVSRRQMGLKSRDDRAMPAAPAAPALQKTAPPEAGATLELFGRQPEVARAVREDEPKAAQAGEHVKGVRSYADAAAQAGDRSTLDFGLNRSQINEQDGRSLREARSKPAASGGEVPVLALVELSAPDPAAQRQAAETLRERFDFREAGGALILPAGSQEQDAGNESERFSEGLAPAAPDPLFRSSIRQSTAPADLWAFVDQVTQETAAQQIVLRRVVAGDALAAALKDVQAEWPAARVEMPAVHDDRASGRGRSPGGHPSNEAATTEKIYEEHKSALKYYFGYPLGQAASAPGHDPETGYPARPAAPRPMQDALAGAAPADVDPQITRTDASEAASAAGSNRAVAVETAPAGRSAGIVRGSASLDRPAGEAPSAPQADDPYAGRRLAAGGARGFVVDGSFSSQPATAAATAPADQQGVILVYLRVASPTTQPVRRNTPAASSGGLATAPATATPPASRPLP